MVHVGPLSHCVVWAARRIAAYLTADAGGPPSSPAVLAAVLRAACALQAVPCAEAAWAALKRRGVRLDGTTCRSLRPRAVRRMLDAPAMTSSGSLALGCTPPLPCRTLEHIQSTTDNLEMRSFISTVITSSRWVLICCVWCCMHNQVQGCIAVCIHFLDYAHEA